MLMPIPPWAFMCILHVGTQFAIVCSIIWMPFTARCLRRWVFSRQAEFACSALLHSVPISKWHQCRCFQGRQNLIAVPCSALCKSENNSCVGGRRFVQTGSLDCSLVDRRNMSGQLTSGSGWPPKGPQVRWQSSHGLICVHSISLPLLSHLLTSMYNHPAQCIQFGCLLVRKF